MPETTVARSLDDKLRAARAASIVLATTASGVKDAGLEAIAAAVENGADRILPANELDLANGRENGLSAGLQDRLRLDAARLAGLAAAVRDIIALPDPVGGVVRGSTLPNGLQLTQVRVPFGVVGAIYEARPNVTIDIAALALEERQRRRAARRQRGREHEPRARRAAAGRARGRRSAWRRRADDRRVRPRRRAAADAGARPRRRAHPAGERATSSTPSCASRRCPSSRPAPGVVHVFLDESADEQSAVDIVVNSKVQRPSVCNALETLLVDARAAAAAAAAGARRRCARRASRCTPTSARGDLPGRRAGHRRGLRHRAHESRPLGRRRRRPRRRARPHPALSRPITPSRSSPTTCGGPSASSPRSTRRSSWSTRAPDSPTAASSDSAPRSASRRRSCTPAARWASQNSRARSGLCGVPARCGARLTACFR